MSKAGFRFDYLEMPSADLFTSLQVEGKFFGEVYSNACWVEYNERWFAEWSESIHSVTQKTLHSIMSEHLFSFVI